jgi:hypothetical protein
MKNWWLKIWRVDPNPETPNPNPNPNREPERERTAAPPHRRTQNRSEEKKGGPVS